MISDIKMKWDSVTRSFVSTGNIGVGSIGKTQINKYVKGYMQIIKKRSGDAFNLYFELGSGMDSNTTEDNDRRNVICQLFTDIQTCQELSAINV